MVEYDQSDLLTRLLRTMNSIPQDEYRGIQLWELLLQISDFSLKATSNMFSTSFSETITVGLRCVFE